MLLMMTMMMMMTMMVMMVMMMEEEIGLNCRKKKIQPSAGTNCINCGQRQRVPQGRCQQIQSL